MTHFRKKKNVMPRPLLPVSALLITVTAIAFLAPVRPASAIPSFSREHQLACTACHTGFPRLNDFGMEFKQRGFRIPGADGKFIWEQNTFPISGVALARLRISHQDNAVTGARTRTRSRFELEEVELMIAGSAAPKIGYFVEFEQEVADGEAFTADQVWVQFSDLLPASQLNLRGGIFLNEFYHLSQKRRFTFQKYISPITFNVTGVELNGAWRRLRYAGGVVNDERTSGSGNNTAAVNLENRLQGFYGWVTYTFTDHILGIRYINTKANSDNPSPVIDGRTRQQLDVNLNLRYGPVELILGYFHNWDLGGVDQQQRRSYLVEGIVEAMPEKLFLDGRFELQDTAFVAGGANNPDTANGTQVSVNASYYVVPNVRIVGEFDKVSGEGLSVFAFAGPNASATTSEERYMLGLHMGF